MPREDGRAPTLPTRASIEAAPRTDIHRGSWSKADIYLVETATGLLMATGLVAGAIRTERYN